MKDKHCGNCRWYTLKKLCGQDALQRKELKEHEPEETCDNWASKTDTPVALGMAFESRED
jgi:hypothetical protein